METPVSLLERLRQPAEDHAWARFVDLYTPIIHGWAVRLGLLEPDAADLVQEVFLLLLRKLPEFTYDRKQSFQGWLWTVTRNKWREQRRRRAGQPVEAGIDALDEMPGPETLDELAEAEYRQQLVRRMLQVMQADFHPTTWKACWQHVVEQAPAAEVAARLGISIDSVYSAKSRVLRRLRQELDGLLN